MASEEDDLRRRKLEELRARLQEVKARVEEAKRAKQLESPPPSNSQLSRARKEAEKFFD